MVGNSLLQTDWTAAVNVQAGCKKPMDHSRSASDFNISRNSAETQTMQITGRFCRSGKYFQSSKGFWKDPGLPGSRNCVCDFQSHWLISGILACGCLRDLSTPPPAWIVAVVPFFTFVLTQVSCVDWRWPDVSRLLHTIWRWGWVSARVAGN